MVLQSDGPFLHTPVNCLSPSTQYSFENKEVYIVPKTDNAETLLINKHIRDMVLC